MFEISSDKVPSGDQPRAIEELVSSINQGNKHQLLRGVTGSGKTYTLAKVIERVKKPTLIIANNKILAAQLYEEFSQLFRDSCAVELFISHFDYYQPECYLPRTNTYIEKSSKINDNISKLRHSATRSLVSRRDVIVVASVSCIYGTGMPSAYIDSAIHLRVGILFERDELLRHLLRIGYLRSDDNPRRSQFRVRGDVLEVYPTYQDTPIRITLFDDDIESLHDGEISVESVVIYPGYSSGLGYTNSDTALLEIEKELSECINNFNEQGKFIEADRIKLRVEKDLRDIREFGYCLGMENYCGLLGGRPPGSPPSTLIDYFPEDSLLIIDESHMTIPSLRVCSQAAWSGKRTLIEYGFRLPSSIDNRPLSWNELLEKSAQSIYVSATPNRTETELCDGNVIEMIVRPTGLVDPTVEIRPTIDQLETLKIDCEKTISQNGRVIVITLTCRMAEDLSEYLSDNGFRCCYLHSGIKSLERIQILNDFRLGEFDILVGVNMLREGLDLPEAELIAIMDADKEGFLRSDTSLIQSIGRVARNVNGRAIFYADQITGSMERAISETNRRRSIQLKYNSDHNINPRTVSREISIPKFLKELMNIPDRNTTSKIEDPRSVEELEQLMLKFAKALRFEEASKIRDLLQIKKTIHSTCN